MQRLLLFNILGLVLFACNEDVSPVDCEKDGPVISLGLVVNASTCGVTDGSISASASQGKEPYSFLLNDLPGQSTGKFENLPAGIYSVGVRDANGCVATVDNVFVNAVDFSFSATITADNTCLTGSGVVIINVSDGNPPYTYKLGNGTFSDNNTFSGLSHGSHAISVKDNNGCSVTLIVTVPRGATGTSWLNDIKPIIEVSCAKSGCHNGSSRTDLRIYENAKFHASSIKSKTKDRSMPREGTLTQDQIDIIGCWVDDGAPEN